MSVPLPARSVPPRRHIAAIVLAVSLGLAACGSDDTTAVEGSGDEMPVATTDAPTTVAPTDDSVDPGGPTDGGHDLVPTDLDMAVSVEVLPDARSGWNVHIESSGFTWTPEDANTDAVDGEGHAHLYIDGEKIGRVYTPWLHVGDDLAPGPHEFRVTLNANDHREYAVDGEVVEATTTVEVGEPAGGMAGAHGDAVEASADMTVDVEVDLDAMRGVNVHVITDGFTWAPERASTDAVDGEGHAHLYLDGEKIGRLYGEWFHLGRDLEPGEHEVRVTLNANDHRDYVVDGEVVEAVTTFTVPG